MDTTRVQVNCVKILKVLADETRLRVLEILMDEGPKYVGEINAILNLEQSLLSHHLQVLRRAKLVVQQRDGKAILYSLAPEVEVTTNKALNLGCCILSFI
ncbi:winged helix-turn-helix transcriptional regulator [Nostoc sp. FACHB-152]|uniref:ArsR/SmtB family transcription factor n=1 Tax=unclassified Nostoc TaxID=2593658 RepID=UPI001688045F|nr:MULTISPECIES: metalloregulator ArsR/SmtB family transcription factor [unclassified Nostoc]MBD2450005.1 winged helix-turn-helix transcriptional regulator [Nostoc sp. FACHB-152]MBD2470125.1 winged helix-turn-helix transcriptional regulator [Nostoc sp. FACHB-145]